MKNKDKGNIAIGVLIIGVIIYSWIKEFMAAHPYWSIFIGILFFIGIGLLIYYSIKKEKIREAEKNLFSFIWNNIRSLISEPSKKNKVRIPLTDKVKNKVYDLAASKCQHCGKNGNLKIHHIDGNPGNNGLNNLILLCGNHHDDADKGVIPKWRLKNERKKQMTAGAVSVKNNSK